MEELVLTPTNRNLKRCSAIKVVGRDPCLPEDGLYSDFLPGSMSSEARERKQRRTQAGVGKPTSTSSVGS